MWQWPFDLAQGKRYLLVLSGFFLLALLVYAPALNGPFQFDDKRVVLDPQVRERRDFWGTLASSLCCEKERDGGAMGTRAIPAATVLANWKLSGMETTGYHVFNVTIHALVAILVVMLVEEMLWWLGTQVQEVQKVQEGKSSTSHKLQAKSSFWFSLVGGLVFLLHPLASQAVAYISQRYVSLTALFYILTVVLYLKARRLEFLKRSDLALLQGQTFIKKPFWFYLGAFVAAFLALSSKESAVTLPVMLVLTEVLVVRSGLKGVGEALRLSGGSRTARSAQDDDADLKSVSASSSGERRGDWQVWLVLGMFFLLALKVPWQIVTSAPPKTVETAVTSFLASQAVVLEKPDVRLNRWTYFLTQFNVIKTYLRMSFLPYGQSIDHDYPLETEFRVWPTGMSLLLLLAIVGVGIYGWHLSKRGEAKQKLQITNYKLQINSKIQNLKLKHDDRRTWLLVPLAVGWFLVPLLVESSVIPIRDLIYEHRAYMSLVGFVILVIFLIYKFYDRYREVIIVGLVALLLIYSGLTVARANVWASEVNLWGDAWRKAPEKDRTNKNYGFVLTEAGRLPEGIERLERAVELNPTDQDYRITLGAAYLRAQDWEKAKAQFEKAVELAPEKADGWNNLGVAMFQLKDYEGSLVAFEESIKQDENFYMAWLGLGGVQTMRGEIDEAEAALNRAIELAPGDVRSYGNLISVYVRTEQWERAWEVIQVAEKIAPNDRDIQLKKEVVRQKLGK
ncbi:MAG: tetratricopeptide repeat protein [Candidatus Chisholmbacteria bacterium]|nr:tetratricopeptide repeat protein [Candidatus Chisholmbacteria bacterium]